MTSPPTGSRDISADEISSPTRRWCSVECFSSIRSENAVAAVCRSRAEGEQIDAKMRSALVSSGSDIAVDCELSRIIVLLRCASGWQRSSDDGADDDPG